jgi:hypothetical protein
LGRKSAELGRRTVAALAGPSSLSSEPLDAIAQSAAVRLTCSRHRPPTQRRITESHGPAQPFLVFKRLHPDDRASFRVDNHRLTAQESPCRCRREWRTAHPSARSRRGSRGDLIQAPAWPKAPRNAAPRRTRCNRPSGRPRPVIGEDREVRIGCGISHLDRLAVDGAIRFRRDMLDRKQGARADPECGPEAQCRRRGQAYDLGDFRSWRDRLWNGGSGDKRQQAARTRKSIGLPPGRLLGDGPVRNERGDSEMRSRSS